MCHGLAPMVETEVLTLGYPGAFWAFESILTIRFDFQMKFGVQNDQNPQKSGFPGKSAIMADFGGFGWSSELPFVSKRLGRLPHPQTWGCEHDKAIRSDFEICYNGVLQRCTVKSARSEIAHRRRGSGLF